MVRVRPASPVHRGRVRQRVSKPAAECAIVIATARDDGMTAAMRAETRLSALGH